MKCISPKKVLERLLTLLTGFPNWDVSRVLCLRLLTYLQMVNMVKIQFTDLTKLLPQIQQFQDNYNMITLNGHSRLSDDLATFMFYSSLPDSYEPTTQQYLNDIMVIANYKLTDIIA